MRISDLCSSPLGGGNPPLSCQKQKRLHFIHTAGDWTTVLTARQTSLEESDAVGLGSQLLVFIFFPLKMSFEGFFSVEFLFWRLER